MNLNYQRRDILMNNNSLLYNKWNYEYQIGFVQKYKRQGLLCRYTNEEIKM